jgi:cytochrome c-type protein NapC
MFAKLKSTISNLFKPSKKWWLLGLPVGAYAFFAIGIMFWGGFNWSMELTNTEAFCTSCHEMQETVFEEYKQTIHYKNASGVRASCPDCHVPRPWVHKVARKIKATNELYHKMLGTIDTPQKFEQHRLEMANRVWAEMRANDSRECRNCHDIEFMDIAEQSKRAKRKHDFDKIKQSGKTCIDCHQGIAHELPQESFDDSDEGAG